MAVIRRTNRDGTETKTWTVRYYEPTPDGKRVQRWRGGFTSKREAQAFEVSVKDQINKQLYTHPTKMLLSTFPVDEFLPGVKVSRRLTTYESYEMHCRVHIIYSHVLPQSDRDAADTIGSVLDAVALRWRSLAEPPRNGEDP